MKNKDDKKSCRGRTSRADARLSKEVKQLHERQKALVSALQSINQRLMLLENEKSANDRPL